MAWTLGILGLVALALAALGLLIHGTTAGGLPMVKLAAQAFALLGVALIGSCVVLV